MPTLADILLGADPEHPDGRARSAALVGSCVRMIEQHVARRGGLKGIGLRTGMGMLKAAKPDILPRAVGRLLPEFAVALEPLYQQFRAKGTQDFSAHLAAHENEAVAALLEVADQRVKASPNAAIKSVYARLRGGAEHEVAAILPGLAAALSAQIKRA